MPVPREGGGAGRRERFMLMPFWETLCTDLWDLTRVAIVCRNALPIDFSVTNGALPALSWSCLDPSPQRAAAPGDGEIGDSVSLFIRLLLIDVSQMNYNGKGIWSEALSGMPWFKEQDADYKSKQHLSHPTSTYWCTKTPLATSSAQNKWNQCLVPAAILKYPLARAFRFAACPMGQKVEALRCALRECCTKLQPLPGCGERRPELGASSNRNIPEQMNY